MKCPNCGMELPEDSIFCENCGRRVDADVVYCTNCGRKFSSEDLYCDYCGTRLSGREEEEKFLPMVIPAAETKKEETEKKPFSAAGRWFGFVTAAVLALVVIWGAFFLLTGGGEADRTRLLYYQDERLYLTDVRNRGGEGAGKEPEEITSSLTAENTEAPYGLVSGDRISRDGKYLFYREDFDGETYDLYRRKLSGDVEAEKIDSNISQYQVLKNNTVLYVKRESLYYFDGHDSVRFGRNIAADGFQTDKTEKYLFWMEDNGEDGYACYYQDLAGKHEKTVLDEGAKVFYPNEELTGFIELKYDNLYQVDNKGNKKRIAGNVVQVASCDPETGRIYYLAESPAKASYEDVINEDLSMSEEDHARLREMGRFELPYLALRYYDGTQDSLITDRFYPGASVGFYDSRDGRYCLYMEGPEPGELQVNWSRFRDEIADEDFGARVLDQAEADGLFSCMKLAAGGKTVGELKDVDNAAWFESSRYCEDTDKLYITAVNYETEEGILCETGLSGNGAGKLKELDSDAFHMGEYVLTGDGIYYIKGDDPDGGDLYLNGAVIDYDVFRIWQLDGGRLVYLADCEHEDKGRGIYATLMVMDGREKRLILDDVSFADMAGDGTGVILADYDFARREGELIYYDGAEKHVIAEDAAGFAPRYGSLQIEPGAWTEDGGE